MSSTKMSLKRFHGTRITQFVLIIGALTVAGLLVWLLWPKTPLPLRASLVAEAAPADTSGFARAEGPALSGVEGPRPLAFPMDHGPHDDFQTEWWYYTGNLTADTGEHFGYQLTFFRRALIPPDQRSARGSAWADRPGLHGAPRAHRRLPAESITSSRSWPAARPASRVPRPSRSGSGWRIGRCRRWVCPGRQGRRRRANRVRD